MDNRETICYECVEPLRGVPDQLNNQGRVTPENTFNQTQVKLPPLLTFPVQIPRST